MKGLLTHAAELLGELIGGEAEIRLGDNSLLVIGEKGDALLETEQGNVRIRCTRPLACRLAELAVYDYLARDRARYNLAVVGVSTGNGYGDPPTSLSINVNLVFVPLLVLPFLMALFMGPLHAMLAGTALLIFGYLAVAYYVSLGCADTRTVRVVKAYVPRERLEEVRMYIRRWKKRILAEPSLMWSLGARDLSVHDMELESGTAKICVASDKAPNAVAVAAPLRNAILLTSGLLAYLDRDEVQAVLRHEEGHLNHRHTYKLLALAVAEYVTRVSLIFGVPKSYMGAALIGMYLLGVFLTFTAVSQLFELEADKYAMRGNRLVLARALIKLGWNSIVEEKLFGRWNVLRSLKDNHPSMEYRVRRALSGYARA